ncbi:MAG: asparaginase [Prolixibacteraceae bacterium]|jgi:L-asparaginase|nr:asparaginase [Prolixibacteraceae bacterium]
MSSNEKAAILIIYTGGTIGMREDPVTKTLAPMKFGMLLDEIPELNKLGYSISSITFNPPIDSSNMTPAIWTQLAKTIQKNYSKFDGFVILHGTDTMSYTASALSYMFENLDKAIVMTGSQLPIGVLRTDGKENIITAVQIAAARKEGRSIVPEVCIYFDSQLFRGNRTTKKDSAQFSAFASHNYPPLAKAGVDIVYNFERINYPKNKGVLKINTTIDDRVIILKIFPGLNRHYFESILQFPDLRGVVLESYGSGNMPTSPWLIAAIKKATKRGLILMNVSQCPGGKVVMGHYETSIELQKAGVINGKDSTVEAAVTKLMFMLGQNLSHEETKYYLSNNLKGEIEL